eukprot:3614023-Rhodomonas_salina.1
MQMLQPRPGGQGEERGEGGRAPGVEGWGVLAEDPFWRHGSSGGGSQPSQRCLLEAILSGGMENGLRARPIRIGAVRPERGC